MKKTIQNPKKEIVVLGVGTAKDRALRVSVWAAARKMGIIAEVVLVSDINRILASGIGEIPALVIDNEVVLEGRLPSISEIMEILQPFA
ncbi:MAG: thioredoxin family protein [Haliscomenobacter sp.]